MKKLIIKGVLLLVLTQLCSCSDDTVVNNVTPTDNSPMWPQAGYDSRHTGDINAMKTYIQPVAQGQLDWSYDFPPSSFSDGSEFCIDSKSNIHFISQSSPWGALYKFTTDGRVIWKIDSINSYNYAAISLSADEKRIYFVAYRPSLLSRLYCYDSSGSFIWRNDSLLSDGSKPVIGKDGTIYSLAGGLSAIDPNGRVKWNHNFGLGYAYPELSLDNDENIYTAGDVVKKISKDGVLQWEFDPQNVDFYTWCIVIDGFNNLYFTDYRNSLPTMPHLFSLNKDGQLRWSVTGYGGGITCAITKDNKIIVDGDSIRAYDTSGVLLWKKSALPDSNLYGHPENVFLDGEDNIYYLSLRSFLTYACSLTFSGERRFNYFLGDQATLPKIALSPMGKLLFSPKRSYKIYSVK